MSHDCIFESQPVPDAPQMSMHRCRCHDSRWSVRRFDDAAYRCPQTGETDPTEPKDAA